jgi:SulP family sulfate permease
LDDALRIASPGEAPAIPELDILRIDGSLFFGAVEHVRDELEAARRARPAVRHVLLLMRGVNFVDASGAALLAQQATMLRASGVTLYLAEVKPDVLEVLERAGHLDVVGLERIFDSHDLALRHIYPRLEPNTCAMCKARVFGACRSHLPDGTLREPPRPDLALTPPDDGR